MGKFNSLFESFFSLISIDPMWQIQCENHEEIIFFRWRSYSENHLFSISILKRFFFLVWWSEYCDDSHDVGNKMLQCNFVVAFSPLKPRDFCILPHIKTHTQTPIIILPAQLCWSVFFFYCRLMCSIECFLHNFTIGSRIIFASLFSPSSFCLLFACMFTFVVPIFMFFHPSGATMFLDCFYSLYWNCRIHSISCSLCGYTIL